MHPIRFSPDVAVLCWMWRGTGLMRRDYRAAHVNALARAIRRHTPLPHRFVCITDEQEERFDAEVEVMPTPADALALARIRTPEGPAFPSCYRRLWTFSREAQQIAPRVLMLDIDAVVVGDLTPLLTRQEDFVGWRPASPWGSTHRLGGGTWLLRTGSRADVWTEFAADPFAAILKAARAGCRGSDQAWLTYKLSGRCPAWTSEDGVHSIRDMKLTMAQPPKGARIVHFNGKRKPWGPHTPPWAAQQYDRAQGVSA
jgi:hypothetical protein